MTPTHSSPSPSSPEPDEESSRSLFRAVMTLSLLALLVFGIFFWQNRSTPTPGPSGPAHPPSVASAAIPKVEFREITAEAGIDFVHFNGACGEKLLPETMGGGVAFFDADNDGDPDLLFVNGTSWPECLKDQAPAVSLALYRNDSAGPGRVRFTDITRESGLEGSFYGMGAAIGDFDNDGWTDLYVTAVGVNRLYKNMGGARFIDVTQTAGVGGAEDRWSTSACWFDADSDGDLDLFVCNYVQWSREADLAVRYELTGVGKAYGPPYDYAGTFPYLFRNDGGGRFTDVTAMSGLQLTNRATDLPLGKALGVIPTDLDNDGWMDLVVANDTVQNFAFHNERNGKFKEIAATAGIAFDSFGGTRGAMGIDAGRSSRSHELSIAIGNFANEMTALYVSQAPLSALETGSKLQFSDEAIQQGIGSASRSTLTFGVFFFDYDLDGWEDLLTVNGHIEPAIGRFDPDQAYLQPAQLFWNAHQAAEAYLPVNAARAGADLFEPMAGRGSAFADVDLDGDLDVVMTQVGGRARLLRNDQTLGRHWLRVKLAGGRSNRDAIGARLRLEYGGKVRWRQVQPTRGYLSQSELPVTFGLGEYDGPVKLEILWPGSVRQSREAIEVDQRIRIVEGR